MLAAHVTWNRTLGPFFRLGELEPGQQVEVALEDGSIRIYEVVERVMYDKDELPRERIWRNTGPESPYARLSSALITPTFAVRFTKMWL